MPPASLHSQLWRMAARSLLIRSLMQHSGRISISSSPCLPATLRPIFVLSFITGRRALFRKIVDEFEAGNTIMYIARNIGLWKEKSNTLSVYDVTILTLVFGERQKKALQLAFESQILEIGYGQEVIGTFTVSNFNESLVTKECSLCKDTQIAEGGYCFPCGKEVDIHVVSTIEGIITQEHSAGVTEVTLSAPVVDRVLQLQDSFINLYNQNPILLRVALSDVEVYGKFYVDTKAQVVSFVKASNA